MTVTLHEANNALPQMTCTCMVNKQHGVPCRHAMSVLDHVVISSQRNVSFKLDALRANIASVCRIRAPFDEATSIRSYLAKFGHETLPGLVVQVCHWLVVLRARIYVANV